MALARRQRTTAFGSFAARQFEGILLWVFEPELVLLCREPLLRCVEVRVRWLEVACRALRLLGSFSRGLPKANAVAPRMRAEVRNKERVAFMTQECAARAKYRTCWPTVR